MIRKAAGATLKPFTHINVLCVLYMFMNAHIYTVRSPLMLLDLPWMYDKSLSNFDEMETKWPVIYFFSSVFILSLFAQCRCILSRPYIFERMTHCCRSSSRIQYIYMYIYLLRTLVTVSINTIANEWIETQWIQVYWLWNCAPQKLLPSRVTLSPPFALHLSLLALRSGLIECLCHQNACNMIIDIRPFIRPWALSHFYRTSLSHLPLMLYMENEPLKSCSNSIEIDINHWPRSVFFRRNFISQLW